MSILDQIKASRLSKQGRTNPSGIFEGTPENVALVRRGVEVPTASTVIPPIINPTDVTFNALQQPTYLDFLKSSPTR